jgi:cytochrome c oxidase assembly protein subunit 11
MSEQLSAVKNKSRYVGLLSLAGVLMFGFGFALVPLYQVFCDAFGVNGRFFDIEKGVYAPSESVKKALAHGVDTERLVTIQFLANENTELPWEFRPVVKEIKVHPGEVREVSYLATNLTDKPVAAHAVPSIAPGQAVKYFNKIECFCFTQQTLQAHEQKNMPLRFVVDRNLPRGVTELTLAYTFYQDKENTETKVSALSPKVDSTESVVKKLN